MLLPDNGKVVIIDDKLNEVKDLISGLSSEGIPFVYYSDEKGEDLPQTPLSNVRLIFLDLLLIDDNNPPVNKVISSIVGRLKRIISTNNGPYILIYWSTQKNRYSKALENEFNKKILKQYRPFAILSLTKPSSIQKVKEELSARFDKFKSLRAFLLLESLVNESVGKVVNEFSGIFINDDKWDKNLKGIIYKTGQARIGSDKEAISKYKSFDKFEKLKSSFYTLAPSIFDELERSIANISEKNCELDEINDFDTSSLVKSKINSKLHIRNCSSSSKYMAGNLFLYRAKHRDLKEAIVVKNLQDPTKVDQVKAELIAIDVTPVCDYSQDKNYNRILYGIMINESEKKLFNGSLKFSKQLPLLFVKGSTKQIILDFRFCDSIPRSRFDKLKSLPSYRLDINILTEIQTEFAKHINRPGIVNL